MVEHEKLLSSESGERQGGLVEATDENIKKTEEDLAQAQLIRAQIQELQSHNSNYAWMLSLILTYVDDEVMQCLSKQLNTYQVSIPAVFAQVVPFMADKTELAEYFEQYPDIAAAMHEYTPTLTGIVSYLQLARQLHQELTNEPLTSYVQFVTAYADMLDLIDRSTRDAEKLQEFIDSLAGQL